MYILNDGTEYLTKMNEMLEASNGSTVINLKYGRECENQTEFDKFMLEWMQENNYENCGNYLQRKQQIKKLFYEIV
uniref:Uncharacterized protein n=1 Tax=Panagrolaimus davidi TaxID=227884 RepID=A0A914P9W7_9BILA